MKYDDKKVIDTHKSLLYKEPMSTYFKNRWLRNQMEDGLWKYLASVPDWGSQKNVPEVPKVFRSRIKKLLNLDRQRGNEKNSWAFYDSEGGGTGTQELYSDYHIFNMAIALNMLSTGFKQSEIIFFMQEAGTLIKKIYEMIFRSDLIAPVCGAKRNVDSKAQTVYMLINRVEMKEMWPGGHSKDPVFMEPQFVQSNEGLKNVLNKRQSSYTAFIVIELVDAVLTLPSILENIPAANRGRPA